MSCAIASRLPSGVGERHDPRAGIPGLDSGDASPYLRVEQEHVAGGVADGERALIGAKRGRRYGFAGAAKHTDGGRAVQQRGAQVPARLRRVVERDGLAGEQRAVQAVLGEGTRAEPLRVGRGRLLARGSALLERDAPGDQREHQQRGDAGERGAQAALGALGRGTAVVDEGALDRVELGLVPSRPVQRRRQARTAVQLARIAAAGIPLARGGAQLTMQMPTLRVVLEAEP